MDREEIETKIIEAATIFLSLESDHNINPSSSLSSETAPSLPSNQNFFDIKKFSQLIRDLICIRDEILFLPENQSIDHLLIALAAHVNVPEGTHLIEIHHLVELFMKWNEVINNIEVRKAGGQNLPSLSERTTALDIQELYRQRSIRGRHFHSHRGHDWLYTSGERRGLLVPIEMILEQGDWKFHDHGDGTGLLYLWSGSESAAGQRDLLTGSTVGYFVQRSSSLGAPTQRTNDPQHHPQHVIRKVEDSEMIADSQISLPIDTPDPRDRLVEQVNMRIQTLGYSAIEVGSGGDCFFRCLAAQLPFFHFQPSDEHSLLARQLIVEFLSNHQALYQDFIAYDTQTPSFQVYLQRMSQPNTWIEGGLEVLAAAIVFNVRIHIFGANPSYDRVINPLVPNNDTQDIELVHYHDYHYRVLQRPPPPQTV